MLDSPIDTIRNLRSSRLRPGVPVKASACVRTEQGYLVVHLGGKRFWTNHTDFNQSTRGRRQLANQHKAGTAGVLSALVKMGIIDAALFAPHLRAITAARDAQQQADAKYMLVRACNTLKIRVPRIK